MKNFYDFRVENNLILENPMLGTYFNKEKFNSLISKPMNNHIVSNKHDATKIDENHFVMPHGDGKLQYSIDHNGNTKSFSKIENNVQTLACKQDDSGSEDLHKFMRHHVETNGHLSTDAMNTNGSKNLWVSLIKNEPNYKFEHIKPDGTKTILNKDNIDHKEPEIWGSDYDFSKHLIRMSKNE